MAVDRTLFVAAPGSWKSFATCTEYVDFMEDPSRIVRLEWRKVRRQEHHGLTSHSWLEAHLVDGRRTRLEVFGDIGLTETTLEPGRLSTADSEIYEDRIADSRHFKRPLTVDGLRQVALPLAARPYSVTENNCHHFVRDVWNSVVIELLQRTHYPDRVKTGVLWGATGSIGRLFFGAGDALAPFGSASCSSAPSSDPGVAREAGKGARRGARRPSRDRFCASMSRASSRPHSHNGRTSSLLEARGDADDEPMSHARISARQEGDTSVTGAIWGGTPCGDEVALDTRFAELVAAGAVYLLQPGSELVNTSLRAGGPGACQGWARSWLGAAGPGPEERIARLIAGTDVVELLQRIVPRCARAAPDGGGVTDDETPPPPARQAPAFASVSSRSRSTPESRAYGADDVADTCFVVLAGEELRLAIYAVLRPPAGGAPAPPRRLRLLSGDRRSPAANREASFVYTLRPVDPGGAGTAPALLEEEAESLAIALATGEWGFVTLL